MTKVNTYCKYYMYVVTPQHCVHMAQGSAGRGTVTTEKELCVFFFLWPFLPLFAAEWDGAATCPFSLGKYLTDTSSWHYEWKYQKRWRVGRLQNVQCSSESWRSRGRFIKRMTWQCSFSQASYDDITTISPVDWIQFVITSLYKNQFEQNRYCTGILSSMWLR